MSRKKITDGLRKKANGVWELSEVIGGKRRWFSSLNPEEVWKKRNAAIAEAENAQVEKDKGPLFSVVADAYKSQVLEMKYGTQRSYIPAVDRAVARFGECHMREIEPYMISEFLNSLSAQARTTVSNQKTVLNAIFQTWVESPEWKGEINPAKAVSIPRGLKHTKRQPPTDEQVKIVKDHYMDPDALPAVVFLCTGERRGEACGIQLKDIDFEAGTISINNAVENRHNRPYVKDTKTPAGVRKVPLLKMLRRVLEPLRNCSPDTYVLGGMDTPLKTTEYERLWTAFWRKYGFAHQVEHHGHYKCKSGTKERTYMTWAADVCAHQFRHEYVCMLCEAGVPEEIAIQLVGHANVQMIHEVYLSLKPKMIFNAGTALDKLLVD